MKRLIATVAALLLPLVLARVAHAQGPVPDTTSAWRYLPLQVGNVWEYELSVRECVGGTCDIYVQGYERWRVEEEVEIEGRRYAMVNMQGYSVSGIPGDSRSELVRFDTLTARGIERTADGTEVMWPGGTSCRLNAPFEADIECDGGVFVRTSSLHEVEVVVNEESETRIRKGFYAPTSRTTFVADIGLSSEGEYPNEYEWERSYLIFARVGALEYGTERFPVPIESAPESTALMLSVFPNPARGAASVRFSLDQPRRVAVTVYDVLGRRVATLHDGPLPAGSSRLAFDGSALPAGVYFVHVVGSGVPLTAPFTITP